MTSNNAKIISNVICRIILTCLYNYILLIHLLIRIKNRVITNVIYR